MQKGRKYIALFASKEYNFYSLSSTPELLFIPQGTSQV